MDKKPSHMEMVTVQATAGMVAGACSSVITTPIDTVKTRLQVLYMILYFPSLTTSPRIKNLFFQISCLVWQPVEYVTLEMTLLLIIWIWISLLLKVIDDIGGGRPSVLKTARALIKEDGWRGFYRGFGPRFLNMSLYGTSMIVTYELISMFTF